jgi:hypothetical protein
MNAQAEQMEAFVDELAILIGGAQRSHGHGKVKEQVPVRQETKQRLASTVKRDTKKSLAGRASKDVPSGKLLPFDEDDSTF